MLKSSQEVVTNVNKKFGRRSWVKLWVNEWLDGTTRFEMSDAQRAFWIDLLAMAGRSRMPGVICAGQVGERFIGYPLTKFQSLLSEAMDVDATLNLFQSTGKIRIEVTQDEPIKLYKIELLNWDKYQSEYQRQKPYRTRLQKGDSQSYNQSNKTEVETEVEAETDKKKPKPCADARHTPIKSYIREACETNKVPFTWDGSDAKALSQWLKSVPSLSVDEIKKLIVNRVQSDVPLGERPRIWIPHLAKYAEGPLDRFGKVKKVRL